MRTSLFRRAVSGMVIALMTASCAPKGPTVVVSPDSDIEVTVTTTAGPEADALAYSVTYRGVPVITESPLGISLTDDVSFALGLTLNAVSSTSLDATYAMKAGKSSTIRNHYNESTLTLADADGHTIDLSFRVFDDGVAYRYGFPEQAGLTELAITGEMSSFTFTGDLPYWGLHLNSFTTSYETDYTTSTLGAIPPKTLLGLPLLVKVRDDVWAAVTEADLTDYAGMYLVNIPGDLPMLMSVLSPLPDDPDVCVRTTAPRSTPWRVLMLGDAPGRLVESNIVLNLSRPLAIDDSWVRPGKTAWDWWNGQVVKDAGFTGAMDTRTMKHFIDFSAEAGLEYMLVDAGWYHRYEDVGDSEADGDITICNPGIDIPELVRYGAEKNVGILVWLHWKPVWDQMDTAFPLYEQWGVKGIKVDFMDRDDQPMVNFYERVAKTAAEHKLLVDFHGAFKPTGLRRAYPNVITREGVMGLEYSKWSERVTPDHDCILPFTRMLAGPLDYTPGGFTNARKDAFVPRNSEPMTQGTRCHQLAMYVVYESPLQMLVDFPANYRGQTGLDFLTAVPATWDETRVLDGQPGDFIVMARRSGDDWYLGAMTDWTPRELTAPLDFLGEGEYVADIYADGPNAATTATDTKASRVVVTANDTLTITMAPGGGQAVWFRKAE